MIYSFNKRFYTINSNAFVQLFATEYKQDQKIESGGKQIAKEGPK